MKIKKRLFKTYEELIIYCKAKQIELNNEITDYTLSKSFLEKCDETQLSDLWNITSDLAYSLNKTFIGDSESYLNITKKYFGVKI